jgi:hypothetical protein
MVIHFVRIKAPLAAEEIRQIMERRAPRFREVSGLVQKYHGYEPESGAFCGCYIFDSKRLPPSVPPERASAHHPGRLPG